MFNFPVRVAQPENMVGMTDQLQSPAYSTSVGLLEWTVLMNTVSYEKENYRKQMHEEAIDWSKIGEWLRRLLP
jgi:cell division protein FtsA